MTSRQLTGLLIASAAIWLAGCGILGGGEPTPTLTPEPPIVTEALAVATTPPPPAAPVLTVSANKTDLKPGDEVTVTGQNTGVGNPRYSLSLTNNPPATGQTSFSVVAGETLPAQAGPQGSLFDLVSATGAQGSVTFVLKAKASGKVTANLSTTGEVAGPGGAFVNGGSTATQALTLNVSLPAAALKIEAPTGEIGVGRQITIRLANPDGAAYTTYTLEIVSGLTKETFSATAATPYQPVAAKPESVFEVASVTVSTGGADFVLKALKAGSPSLTGSAIGDVEGKTDTVKLTVVEGAGLTGTGGSGGGAAKTYTVKAGDTLFSIGRTLGVDWTAIASANGIVEPYIIHVGDTLTIPAAGGPGKYVVQQGDWLYKIARALGIDWAELARVNGLTPPYVIYPGDVLTLP